MKTAKQLKHALCPMCEVKGCLSFVTMRTEYSKDRDRCERSSKYRCGSCGKTFTDTSDIGFYVRETMSAGCVVTL